MYYYVKGIFFKFDLILNYLSFIIIIGNTIAQFMYIYIVIVGISAMLTIALRQNLFGHVYEIVTHWHTTNLSSFLNKITKKYTRLL